MSRTSGSKKIVFGVTAAESLKLLGNLPLKMQLAGWSVFVISGAGSKEHDPWGGDIKILEIPMRREISAFADLRAMSLWILTLNKIKPAVVMIGTPKASLLGLLSAKLTGVPHRVYLLRGLRLETLTGTTRRASEIAERLSAHSATQIIAVSRSLCQKYTRLGLAPEKSIEVIGEGSSHGVDVRKYQPSRANLRSKVKSALGFDPEQAVLGFVGRFSEDKGSKSLVSLAEKLRGKGYIVQMLLVGVVENSSEELSSLSSLCHHLVTTGATSDTSPFFKAMDVLLLPTKREGFPNVVLEAAASGVPCVTTSATGASDSVKHMHSGLIAELGSELDYFFQVEKILSDEHLRETLGTNARIRAVQFFDDDVVEKNYLNYLVRLDY